jgi:molybdate-binding protein/DNA-binding XRE family transcriptional regulator
MGGPASHKLHAADPADPARAHGEPNGMRLRLARQARGFSQQQLAGMAGVSRQAVSAVESGLSDPSLRVALALARALGLTVEEMFGPRAPAPQIDAQPLSPLGDGGGRVTLASIGDTFVALPLSGAAVSKAGFVPADGLAVPAVPAGSAGPAGSGGPGHSIRPLSPPRPTLVVAGCDPAIPLLEAPLGLLDPPVSFAWWQCASGEALDLAARGLVHVAGAHLRGQGGDYNVGSARSTLRRGAQIMGFCSWREGLVLRPGLPVASVADVVRARLRLVNREPGSEARLLLDRELAALGADPGTLPGYQSQATGHLHVASAIAAGLADVGVASEPAALAYGLDFVPLAAERFDLVIPADRTGSREAQALLKVLSSRWLLDQLTSLPGYDPARCGELIATLPPLGPPLGPSPAPPSGAPAP